MKNKKVKNNINSFFQKMKENNENLKENSSNPEKTKIFQK
jgi:hypothetical protein